MLNTIIKQNVTSEVISSYSEYMITVSEISLNDEIHLQYGLTAFDPYTQVELYSFPNAFNNISDAENFLSLINNEFIEKDQLVYILNDYLSEL